MSDKYDVVVIGSGPAGYVAAIKAAQLGCHCLCRAVAGRQGQDQAGWHLPQCRLYTVQGAAGQQPQVCRGPRSFRCARHSVGKPSMDVPAMLKRKDKIVNQLTGGIAGLFKHNGVTAIAGTGKVLAGAKVEVTDKDGKVQVLRRQHHYRRRLVPVRYSTGADRQRIHHRFHRRAGIDRSARTTGRYRRRGHRPGAGQCLGPTGFRGCDAGSTG